MKETWGTWFYRRPTNPPNHLREWLGGIDSIEIVNLKIPWGLWFYRCIFRKRVRASRIITIKLSTPTLSLNSKGDISAILWPMGFSRFPRKKRSIGLRCRPPHACIHLEKFMYPLALVSGAPHKAYIFRFNTPTNNTFPMWDALAKLNQVDTELGLIFFGLIWKILRKQGVHPPP